MVKKVKTSKNAKVKKTIIDETPGVAMNRVIAATRQYLVAHKVLFWAMFGVVILLAWFFVFRYPVIQEKRQFDKAEVVLDELHNAIVAEFGEPISTEKVKSCGYSSAKYSKGILRCRVGYVLSYKTIGVDLYNDTNRLESLISITPNIVIKYNTNSHDAKGDFYAIGFNVKNYDFDYCSVINRADNDAVVGGMEISLSCSTISKAEHYPVIEH